ncbi:MAG: aldo/keto reductase [Pseudomonadota bacterium]
MTQTLCDISKIGFGAAGAWGKSWFSENKAQKLIAAALDHGIRHFDTAGFYAGGVAETRLGKALQDLSANDVEISSKAGTEYGSFGRPAKDFSAKAIERQVDTSLKRLNREQLDILYLHGPTPETIDMTKETLLRLTEIGKIKKIGVCGEGQALEYAIKTSWIDIIMGRFNALDQSHADIFALAKQKGVQTVAIAPLGQALYRKSLFLPRTFSDLWYLARAIGRNPTALKRAQEVDLSNISQLSGRTAAEAMLAFTLSNQDIDIVLSSTTRIAHLQSWVQTVQSSPLKTEEMEQLIALGQ